ncbi:MAG: hypothetical protein ACLFUP_08510, partial [Desulfobacteraceae bacterium]
MRTEHGLEFKMSERLKEIGEGLESMALEVVSLDPGDIPAMGRAMNVLENLEAASRGLDDPVFLKLVRAVKNYMERLI